MPWRLAVGRWSIPFGLGCMVVAFAAGSSSAASIKRVGLDARWAVLLVVCAVSSFLALRHIWAEHRLPSRGTLRISAFGGAFLVLAVVSTAWSVAPRLTFERAGSLALLFLLAAALAASAAADVAAQLRILQGLAAGAIAVGVLGVFMLGVDYDAAVQRASGLSPWRYRGITENPNTISILAAASVPIMTGLALRSARRGKIVWSAGALLLLASTVAAESRGGLLAACLGMVVVFMLALADWRVRLVGVAAALLVLVGGTALRQAVQPRAPEFSSQVAPAPGTPTTPAAKTAGPKSRPRPGVTQPNTPAPSGNPGQTKLNHMVGLPQEQDEVGHPLLTKKNVPTAGSGRIAAWLGALELVGDRPLLGYGFGTEQRVFVDRWYYFQGGTTENSYLGLLLQLGALGLALIVVLGAALLGRGVRAAPALHGDARAILGMLVGVLVAAAGIMLIQSYLYSVGNIATATVWISLFLLGAVVLEPRPQGKAIVPAGREERDAVAA
jgi:O-antigen ligase